LLDELSTISITFAEAKTESGESAGKIGVKFGIDYSGYLDMYRGLAAGGHAGFAVVPIYLEYQTPTRETAILAFPIVFNFSNTEVRLGLNHELDHIEHYRGDIRVGNIVVDGTDVSKNSISPNFWRVLSETLTYNNQLLRTYKTILESMRSNQLSFGEALKNTEITEGFISTSAIKLSDCYGELKVIAKEKKEKQVVKELERMFGINAPRVNNGKLEILLDIDGTAGKVGIEGYKPSRC